MSLRTRALAGVAHPRVRVGAVDRVRGLAIAAMVVDHLCLTFGGPELVRLTVGRLAVPLFFVLSGYLVSRVSWRTAGIGLVGLWLPAVVGWVDSPNVLLWYAAGAAVLVACRSRPPALVVLVVLAGTVLANGWDLWPFGGYHPLGLLALMAVGQLVRVWAPGSPWGWGARLPAVLEHVGRFPLSVYVGHLLVLHVVWSLGYWRV